MGFSSQNRACVWGRLRALCDVRLSRAVAKWAREACMWAQWDSMASRHCMKWPELREAKADVAAAAAAAAAVPPKPACEPAARGGGGTGAEEPPARPDGLSTRGWARQRAPSDAARLVARAQHAPGMRTQRGTPPASPPAAAHCAVRGESSARATSHHKPAGPPRRRPAAGAHPVHRVAAVRHGAVLPAWRLGRQRRLRDLALAGSWECALPRQLLAPRAQRRAATAGRRQLRRRGEAAWRCEAGEE